MKNVKRRKKEKEKYCWEGKKKGREEVGRKEESPAETIKMKEKEGGKKKGGEKEGEC